ncbi:SMI1/KNR4 family protein [Aquimarina algiphila]|uniref:SMI1/KNR4 family protein n=1 Tax=Aquimarina algiphila TaxID=2047982 RepID=UPI00232EAB07|nr:SMI1/KNR4 family protein [Aquimarina algiphila]
MILDKRLDEIASKLKRLKKYDKKLKVFGTDSHKYKSKKVSPKKLAKLEKKLGIELPEAFKLFLLKIGTGAGPDYGIFKFKRMEQELEIWKKYLREQNPNKPFDLLNTDAEELIKKKIEDEKTYHYKRLKTANGVLPIATEGCTYYFYLVLSGEQKGKVWGIDVDHYNTMPAGLTKEFSFLEWYENWLDISLSKRKKK